MTELDKFKRRVIRAVARVLRQGGQDKPDQALWDGLQKELGCDCKLLWERMRALTLKKMKRLLPAEDRLRAIADVAQMQLTDWLLFDLVLVHEDIDVIGEDPNSKAIRDLVELIDMYQIEGKKGDDLTTAWTAATFYYNSFGRQCSPMLLQRRWYQLKKQTREKFYSFWFLYRGNPRLLEVAKKNMPDGLNSLVAQKYPHVITKQFKEWAELIEDKFVILPEEFEAKMRAKTARKDTTNEPDLVLVEPQIETIDLGVDSDSEDDRDSKGGASSEGNKDKPAAVTIKKEIEYEHGVVIEEPIETDVVEDNVIYDNVIYDNVTDDNVIYDNVTDDNVIEDNVTDDNFIDDNVTDDNVIDGNVINDNATDDDVIIQHSNFTKDNDESEKNDTIESPDFRDSNIEPTLMNEVVRKSINVNITCKKEPGESPKIPKLVSEIIDDLEIHAEKENVQEDMDVIEDVDDVEILNQPSDEVNNDTTINNKSICDAVLMPQILNVFGNVKTGVETITEASKSNTYIPNINDADAQRMEIDDNLDDLIRRKAEAFTTDSLKEVTPVKIENVDKIDVNETPPEKESQGTDVLQPFVEDIMKEVGVAPVKAEKEYITNPYEDIHTDLNFVDEGIEFEDDGIEFDDNDDDEAAETVESVEKTSASSPNFDMKLLMCPIVYSVKLDCMAVFKNIDITSVKNKQLLETALIESKPVYPKVNEDIIDQASTISINEPAINEPTINEPAINESAINEPTINEPAINEPTINAPAINEPAIKEPCNEPIEAPDVQIHLVEDEEQSEDEIPDKIKVNLSSHLLRKPRSRSYNPIQLCKNPDFNTRLKRLTFGFLSSTRNRSMLKTLKPMTIDLSKAFESKLVNGTMYLKQGKASAVKHEPKLENETEQAIAVLPSAMPIQSLIDNTSVNIREILQPAPIPAIPKPHDGVLFERQKTIKLPDINHIRRINQQMLTAEVTPMVINTTGNFKPPVQIVALETKDLGESKTEAENGNLKPKLTDAEKSSTNDQEDTIGVINRVKCEPASSESVIIDLAKPVDSNDQPPLDAVGNNVKEGECSSSDPSGKLTQKPKKNIPNEKPSYWVSGYRVRPQPQKLPWNQPPIFNMNVQDTLLTLDTLQKMLTVIDEGVTSDIPKTKQMRRADERKLIKKRAELEKRLVQYETQLQKVNDLEKLLDNEKSSEVVTNVDTEVKNSTTTIDKTNKNIVANKQYGDFCCWARMKLNSELAANVQTHLCPRICNCCCRDELIIKTKWSKKQPENQNEIVLSDTDDDIRKKKNTTGGVVNPNKKPSANKKNALKILHPKVTISKKGKTQESIRYNYEVQETELASKSIIPSTISKVPSPVKPHIRLVNKKQVSKKAKKLFDADTPDLDSKPESDTLGVAPAPANPSKSHYSGPHGHIIIDPTNRLIVHNKSGLSISATIHNAQTRLINAKKKRAKREERTLYINDKKGDNGVVSPIFLAKNKILLTDIKFPKELDPFPNKKKTEQQPVKPIATQSQALVVPLGVQLVLLPNGTLSYTVEPGVELSEEQKSTLPKILTAVKLQLNVNGPAEKLESEMVDLTEGNDDDSVLTENALVTKEADCNDGNVANEQNTENMNTAASEENIQSMQVDENIPDVVVSNHDQQQRSQLDDEVCEIGSNSPHVGSIDEPVIDTIPDAIENAQSEHENAGKDTTNASLLCDEIMSEKPRTEALLTPTDEASQTNVGKEKQSTEDAMGNEQDNIEDQSSTDIPVSSNRKSLLSDLMEMSGIFDEIDTNVSVPPRETVEESLTVPSVDVPQVVHTPIQPIIEPAVPLIPLPNLIPINSVTSTPNIDKPELNPIFTFAQLKYACNNNAQFFKLDLELGTLSCGIKVCIKKQLPKSVIDLTEDDDQNAAASVSEERDTQAEVKDSAPTQPAKYSLPDHLSKSLLRLRKPEEGTYELVKPMKLFRSVRILKQNKEHTVLLPTDMQINPTGKIHRQRKQNLVVPRNAEQAQVIDDDSRDSSIEDEYIYRDSDFLDSSELDDSDSSDDEPLSNKAKRMRMSEQGETTTEQSVIPKAVTTDETSTEIGESSMPDKQNVIAEASTQEEDNNDLSNNLVQELPSNLMAFMPENIDNEDDDDCILGF